MEQQKLQDVILSSQRTIDVLQEQVLNVTRRVVTLENGQAAQTSVQVSMERLASSNERFTEKLVDMKGMLEKIDGDNSAQHQALSDRIKRIEDAPGDRWNKAVWIVITALLMAISSGVTKIFVP